MLRSMMLALVLMATTVKAEPADLPVPPPKMLTLQGGTICDTEEQVVEYLLAIEANGNNSTPFTEGCGGLRGIAQAIVTPLFWHETRYGQVLVARFDLISHGMTQYGWVAFVEKENLGEDL